MQLSIFKKNYIREYNYIGRVTISREPECKLWVVNESLAAIGKTGFRKAPVLIRGLIKR